MDTQDKQSMFGGPNGQVTNARWPTRPIQSFETQYLNTNYFNFRSLFGHKFGLRNHLGDIKVFDLIDI